MSVSNPIGERRYSITSPYVASDTFTSDIFDGRTISDMIVLDTKKSLVLQIDSQGMSKLFASAFAGALLLFPLERTQVLAPLWGAMYMNLCNEIADCINSNTAVQDAILSRIQDEGVALVDGDTAVGTGDDNVLQGTNCDLDAIFGACVAIIDYLDSANRDIIEIIVNEPNVISALVRVIDYVPVLGDLPVTDDASDVVEWVQAETLSSYDAGYTLALRDTMACGLFALACADCDLSTADITSYFASLGGVSVSEGDIWQQILPLFTNLTGNVPFVYGMFAFTSSVLSIGGQLAGITGWRGLATIARASSPDSGHTSLCTPCSQSWVREIDFAKTDGGFERVITNEGGVYVSGTGWQASLQLDTPNNNSRWRLFVNLNGTDLSSTVTEFEVEFEWEQGQWQFLSNTALVAQLRGTFGAIFETRQNLATGNNVLSWSGNVTNVNAIRIDIYSATRLSSQSPPNPTGYATLKRIRLEGTGNPLF